MLPLWLNPDAGVDHFEKELPVFVPGAQPKLAARSGELHRVVDQVPKDLLDPNRIRPDEVIVRRPVRRHAEAFSVNVRLRDGERVVRDRMRVNTRKVELDFSGADAREVEQIVN